MDNHQQNRVGIAEALKISLYTRYTEQQAVAICGRNIKWWKVQRKAGLIPYVQDAGGGKKKGRVYYFGIHLCDIQLLGTGSVMELYKKPGGGQDGARQVGFVTRAEAVIGRPVTPMSYAGVARRTTRRATYGAAAAGAAAYGAARPGCVQVVNAYGQITYRCP